MANPMAGLFLVAALVMAALPAVSQAYGSTPSRRTDSSGLFRDQDTLPGAYRLYLQAPEIGGTFWGLGPIEATAKKISFSSDAHALTPDYRRARPCIDCHAELEDNLHSVRGQVTCVQCHLDQPVISGVFQYYSPMNPIRRHAYVCAKCHEGSTPSFSAYVIHEPNPLAAAAKDDFPLLYYASWFMVIVAGGVFVVFIPYVLFWALRELIDRMAGGGRSSA